MVLCPVKTLEGTALGKEHSLGPSRTWGGAALAPGGSSGSSHNQPASEPLRGTSVKGCWCHNLLPTGPLCGGREQEHQTGPLVPFLGCRASALAHHLIQP